MKYFILCFLFSLPLHAQMPLVGSSLEGSLFQKSLSEIVEDKIHNSSYCEDVKMKDTNLSELSSAMTDAPWPECLKEPQMWKRIVESDRISLDDRKWMSQQLCVGHDEGKILSSKEFCDYSPLDDCPSCLLEIYKEKYGEIDGFKIWTKVIQINYMKMVTRRTFIRNYLLKQ